MYILRICKLHTNRQFYLIENEFNTESTSPGPGIQVCLTEKKSYTSVGRTTRHTAFEFLLFDTTTQVAKVGQK